jgi:hypothetical protein
MSEHDELPADIDAETSTDSAARSVPDGGLGTAMPAWLQQPPAWKRDPIDVPARKIPAPDTSEIDPRTMLDLDDLPRWLQEVARRGAQPARLVQPKLPEVPSDADAPPAGDMDVDVADVVEAMPPVPDTPGVEEPTVTPLPVTSEVKPWWLSDRAVGALFIAIIITILYVLLAASGVL